MTLTAKQVEQIDGMNVAAQRASMGTLLQSLESNVSTLLSNVELTSVSILNAALGTTTAVHAAITLTAEVQEVTTGITSPATPRALSVTGNDGNVAGNVVIVGTNVEDEEITETIVAAGTDTVLGTKAFKTVTSITVPVYDTAGTETIAIGTSDKLGIGVLIGGAGYVFRAIFDGATDAGTAYAGATIETCLFDPAGTLNGVKDLVLILISEL